MLAGAACLALQDDQRFAKVPFGRQAPSARTRASASVEQRPSAAVAQVSAAAGARPSRVPAPDPEEAASAGTRTPCLIAHVVLTRVPGVRSSPRWPTCTRDSARLPSLSSTTYLRVEPRYTTSPTTPSTRLRAPASMVWRSKGTALSSL